MYVIISSFRAWVTHYFTTPWCACLTIPPPPWAIHTHTNYTPSQSCQYDTSDTLCTICGSHKHTYTKHIPSDRDSPLLFFPHLGPQAETISPSLPTTPPTQVQDLQRILNKTTCRLHHILFIIKITFSSVEGNKDPKENFVCCKNEREGLNFAKSGQLGNCGTVAPPCMAHMMAHDSARFKPLTHSHMEPSEQSVKSHGSRGWLSGLLSQMISLILALNSLF